MGFLVGACVSKRGTFLVLGKTETVILFIVKHSICQPVGFAPYILDREFLQLELDFLKN